MSVYHLRGLDALGPALAAWLPRAVDALYDSVRLEIAEEAMAELETLSPVKTGRYRASHTPAVGEVVTRHLPIMTAYPVDGVARVHEAVAGSPADSVVYIANAVEGKEGSGSYAGILEAGRSKQAPEGVYGPTVQALLDRRATIVANGIERARARLGG